MLKKILEVVGWLTAVVLFAFASHAVFAQPTRERGPAAFGAVMPDADAPGVATADGAAAGRQQPQRRARRADDAEDVNPGSIARAARSIYVEPSAHVDAKYLEYKLQKKREFRDWGLMIVEDESAADLVLKLDKAALNYVFRLVDPRTSVVVVSGKVVAVNKLIAAEYLGTEIIKKMRDARDSVARPSKKRKRDRDDDFDETQESES